MLCQRINSKLICLLVYMCVKTKLIVHFETYDRSSALEVQYCVTASKLKILYIAHYALKISSISLTVMQ